MSDAVVWCLSVGRESGMNEKVISTFLTIHALRQLGPFACIGALYIY